MSYMPGKYSGGKGGGKSREARTTGGPEVPAEPSPSLEPPARDESNVSKQEIQEQIIDAEDTFNPVPGKLDPDGDSVIASSEADDSLGPPASENTEPAADEEIAVPPQVQAEEDLEVLPDAGYSPEEKQIEVDVVEEDVVEGPETEKIGRLKCPIKVYNVKDPAIAYHSELGAVRVADIADDFYSRDVEAVSSDQPDPVKVQKPISRKAPAAPEPSDIMPSALAAGAAYGMARAPEAAVAPGNDLVNAVLVDQDEEDKMVAERLVEVEKELPWYKRKSFIITAVVVGIIVIIIIILASVLATGDNDGPTTPVGPTSAPTPSPAPTALGFITVVIQLDSKPWETGWNLTCDDVLVESAPPGTYALVGTRPNFRVDYETQIVLGSECELAIVDTGGDGIDNGFYQVYFGPIVVIGDNSALLAGATVTGSGVTAAFDVVDPGATVPPPTPPTNSTPTTCTVCPDGTSPAFPDNVASDWGYTCGDLGTILQVLPFNSTECRLVHESSAHECGCFNFCTTLCSDGISEPPPEDNDNAVFVVNNEQVTCGQFQQVIVNSQNNSQDQCLSANFLGGDICGCPPSPAFCRICQGNQNPEADFLQTEIVPGVNCLDITGIAYTLRQEAPSGIFFELCPAYVAIGAYCGCEQPPPPEGQEFCRMCGANEDLLPDPARIVDSSILGIPTTCFHMELAANVNSTATLPCGDYQNDAAATCCSEDESERR